MLFRRLDWLPLNDELNHQRSSLILRRTQLLPRNSDRHSGTDKSLWITGCVLATTGKRKGVVLSLPWGQNLEKDSFGCAQEGHHRLFEVCSSKIYFSLLKLYHVLVVFTRLFFVSRCLGSSFFLKFTSPHF